MDAVKSLLIGTAVALGLFAAQLSWSQEAYPGKPVRLVVALGPGSGADALARFLAAEPLRRELQTPIIVENRPGAGGTLGGEYVTKSKPDGYTLALLHSSVVTSEPLLNRTVQYDPLKDFAPVATLVTSPLAIIVSAGARWSNLAQLIDEAKASPGKVNCGLIGEGNASHFNLELLRLASGASMTRVPFPAGSGAIVTALLGGHIDCTSLTWSAVEGQVRAGKLRLLASTSRIRDLPQVPTFAAEGFPRVNLEVFYGVYAPAGLPGEVLGKLASAFEKVMKDPGNIETVRKLGFEPMYQDSAQLGERLKREVQVVKELVKDAGIAPRQ
jgi:tripartite-type tricarboxylate transporter receptor subunit TctC